jgi:hypothetical protein
MYSQGNYGENPYGGYPKTVETHDQFGNPSTVIIPNPW